jgi:hypothetical protein
MVPSGRRLRTAGVSFEDKQDLLGNRSGRITTHYSAAELSNFLTAANLVVGEGSRKTLARKDPLVSGHRRIAHDPRGF